MVTPHARKLVIATAGLLAAGLAALPALAQASTSAPAVSYSFHTYNNSNDETFNQLLGINKSGEISGYFGSGAAGHKNKGYLLKPPYHQIDYVVENFPGSAQTQVTGLNDTGITVGFYSHTNKANLMNANFGFYRIRGKYRTVDFPTGDNSNPAVNQLLGVNDSKIAVGFYVDSAGNAHGYAYDIATGHFQRVKISGAVSLTATGINNHGDVTGFFNRATGPVESFLLTRGGHLYTMAVKGADMTQAFGVNDNDEVVGAITTGSSTFGFTWTPTGGFHQVNDPKGVGSTVINGVNDAGDLVGFYTDSRGNVDGMLATP